MPTTIRISDETFRRLQRWATPLEDSADTALQKVLDAAEGGASSKEPVTPASPRPSGPAIAKKEFYARILTTLLRSEGRGTKQFVSDTIGKSVGNRLSAQDFQVVSTGETTWENRVAWARQDLKEWGLLRSDSPRGIWELTDAGRDLAESRQWPSDWIAPD